MDKKNIYRAVFTMRRGTGKEFTTNIKADNLDEAFNFWNWNYSDVAHLVALYLSE